MCEIFSKKFNEFNIFSIYNNNFVKVLKACLYFVINILPWFFALHSDSELPLPSKASRCATETSQHGKTSLFYSSPRLENFA